MNTSEVCYQRNIGWDDWRGHVVLKIYNDDKYCLEYIGPDGFLAAKLEYVGEPGVELIAYFLSDAIEYAIGYFAKRG